jgi:hypothetical protein
MQRDSDLTLADIHGKIENLVTSIADNQNKALVKVVGDDTPLNLRFITPYYRTDEWSRDEKCCEYALTLPGYLKPGQEYIAVSYTWAHRRKWMNRHHCQIIASGIFLHQTHLQGRYIVQPWYSIERFASHEHEIVPISGSMRSAYTRKMRKTCRDICR